MHPPTRQRMKVGRLGLGAKASKNPGALRWNPGAQKTGRSDEVTMAQGSHQVAEGSENSAIWATRRTVPLSNVPLSAVNTNGVSA